MPTRSLVVVSLPATDRTVKILETAMSCEFPRRRKSRLEQGTGTAFSRGCMASTPTSNAAAKLERFPLEVRDAYRRYCADGDVAALQVIVLAVVRDCRPRPDPAPLADSQRLIEDLGFDSLAVAETVFFFEDLFNVRIENRELLTVRTVGDLRNFVARKVGSGQSAIA